MTHGYIPPEPRQPLFVVTHGLTLTAYVDGLPVAVKRLAQHEAANLAIDLLTGLRMSLGNTPTENLPFRQHEANRRADGVTIHADGDHPCTLTPPPI